MSRGIDHLVLAARDLGRSAEIYRRLGFTVGARNRHPWGTLNHIVQLEGAFLELISTQTGFTPPARSAAVFPFAGFLDGFLARREGFAMLVLESRDAKADASEFARASIATGEPFFFERTGKRADGGDVHVAFTLAFAATPHAPAAGFFVCQQHFPDAFWSSALQQHDNTARRISSTTLVAQRPSQLADFLSAFVGGPVVSHTGCIAADTGRGRVEVMTPAAAREIWGTGVLPVVGDRDGPHLAGACFAVADLAATRAVLGGRQITFAEHNGRLVIPADAALGTALAFEAA